MKSALQFSGIGTSQVLSSLSNVVISTAIAHSAGAEGLGEFAVVFAVYLLVIGFLRALIAEPFHALERDGDTSSDERGMLGASAAYSLASAGSLVLVSTAFGWDHLLALAAVLPPLCLHDAARYIAFRRERADTAAVADGIWLLVVCVAWPLCARSPIPVSILLWGSGGALGSLVALVRLGIRPTLMRDGLVWWSSRARALGAYLGVAGIAYVAADQVAILVVAALVSEAALGQLRAGQILVQPSLMLVTVAGIYILPRLAGRGRRAIYGRVAVRASAATAAASAAVLILVLGALEPVTVILFSEGFTMDWILFYMLGVRAIFVASGTGFTAALKADQRGRAFVGSRLIAGAVGFVAILIGTVGWGIRGTATGMIVQGVLLTATIGWAWRQEARAKGAPA